MISSPMFIPTALLNLGNISQQLARGIAAIDAGQATIDFSQTTSVDSSAVACLLAWKRRAQQRGVNLKFQHLPANLTNLVKLYDVAEFFNS